MNNRAVRTWLVLVVLVMMGGSFAAGVSLKNTSVYGLAAQIVQGMPGLYDYEIDNEIPSATDLRPLATFWEVREKILRNFVYLLEDSTQLTYGAIRGMLDALEDPYSRFLTPEEYAEFNRETEGTFEGIGAWVGQEKEEGEVPTKTVIISIIPGGPAAQVDIMPGDQILAVDEMATEGLTLQKVVKMIQGPAGTSVVLTLKRESREEPFDVEVARARVDVPNVETKILPGNIGYFWLITFNKQAEREAREGLEELLSQDIDGLLLDLSINGGGLLEQAINVSSLFFEDGPIVYVRERGGSPQAYNAVPGALVPSDLPMVVLVDKGTASASEILAGALRDRGRAQVIGQNTFGKSKVQTVIKLNDDSALILSTAVYLTPDMHDVGAPWEEDETKRGLRPDVLLPPPDLESGMRYPDWHEQQIEQAAALLRKQIAEHPAPVAVPAG